MYCSCPCCLPFYHLSDPYLELACFILLNPLGRCHYVIQILLRALVGVFVNCGIFVPDRSCVPWA